LLGPLQTALFKVGFGIVDEAGTLVRDTVAPRRVTGLRGIPTRTGVRLRWRAARDPGGIRGYLVERNRKRFRVVPRTSLSVPRAKAHARWSVRAIDKAGNIGPRFATLRIR
jgi:hypothetical protein